MSDQLKLTTVSNSSINVRSGTSNSDIHAKTISNLLTLVKHRKRRERKNTFGTKLEKKFGSDGFSGRPILNSAVSFGITDSHLTSGSLVNPPELHRKQIQSEMVGSSAMTVNNSGHKRLKILTPEMVRDYSGQFRPFKPRKPTTTTTPEIQSLAGLNRTTVSSTTVTTANSPVSVSIAPKETTTKAGTSQNPHFTTVGYSSEETATVTEIPIQNRTDENDTNSAPEKDEELVAGQRDHTDLLTPDNSVQINETSLAFDSNLVIPQMDLMMFPSVRADVRKRNIERRRFCAGFRLNIGNANVGLRCCMRTLNCFDNLPQYLDETLFHREDTISVLLIDAIFAKSLKCGPCNKCVKRSREMESTLIANNPKFIVPIRAVTRSETANLEKKYWTKWKEKYSSSKLTQDIDDSMHCLERVLDRDNCKPVTSLMNRKMSSQMGKVKQFYQNICPNDPHISTVPQNGKPTTPTNHNNLKSKGFGPIRDHYYRLKRNSESQESSFESDQSLRYKSVSHNRRRSSAYEEIDVHKMVPSINSPNKKKNHGIDESRISRKLPSAPSEEGFKTGNHYYLSPTSSLPEDNRINDNDKGVSNFGYLDLQTDENGQSYAKLKTEEGEYITPEEIASTPKQKEKNPKKNITCILY
ncbi:unnamed protein product [Mytilus edulis]|uniref:Uncharacterized protein n=1 Tax=Mytilus edulis TaxID=6550 RepID=A0A8S3U2C0_MYTED|nr:unnamed protein product [Mytilus edulis]